MSSNIILTFTNQQVICSVETPVITFTDTTRNILFGNSLYPNKTNTGSCIALAKAISKRLDPTSSYIFTVYGKKNRYHGKIKAFIDELNNSSIKLINRK